MGGQRVEVRFAVARGLESEGKKRKNYRAIFGIGGVDFTEQKVTI